MALSYDVALIVEADLPKLTGLQQLTNLESTQLDLTDLILAAHRAVYRRVEQALGASTPAAITNQDRLTSAVAWEAIKRLALGGYLGDAPTPEQAQAEVDRELAAYRPELSTTADEGRHALENVPAVVNFEGDFAFGPLSGTPKRTDRFSSWIPRVS